MLSKAAGRAKIRFPGRKLRLVVAEGCHLRIEAVWQQSQVQCESLVGAAVGVENRTLQYVQ